MTMLSPLAQSLIEASVAALNNNGPAFISHMRAQDWIGTAADIVALELDIAAAAGVPGAGIARNLVPLAIYMAHHPADPSDPAMQKAAGSDNVSFGG